jgi:hypothetical protein
MDHKIRAGYAAHFRKLSYEDMREANRVLIEVMRERQSIDGYRAKAAMSVGQIATWLCSKTHVNRYIRITKMNIKTVSGQEVDANGVAQPYMRSWRVQASLLKPVVVGIDKPSTVVPKHSAW